MIENPGQLVFCNGYGSCGDINTYIVDSHTLRCGGARSCQTVDFLKNDGIYGYGYMSIAGVNNLNSEYLRCNGDGSCTKINQFKQNNDITCDGLNSCKNLLLEDENDHDIIK